MPHRPDRLAEIIREELTDLITGELRDPRVGLAQITEVKVPPEMTVAHVFVSVLGDAGEQAQTMRGLISARNYLRAELAGRLRIRHVPELRFELDRSEELSARLDRLLYRAHKRERKNAPVPDGAGADERNKS
jgi:ribosome-binding factor A